MTLRQRGYGTCLHPEQEVEIRLASADVMRGIPERWDEPIETAEERFCRTCGARLVDGRWRGGSIDYDRGRALAEWGSLRRWWEAVGR